MDSLVLSVVLMLAGALILIGLLTVSCAWMCLKVLRMLMWFHGAGRALATHEIQMAELDVRKSEAEVKKMTVEASARRGGPPPKFGEQGMNRVNIGANEGG